MSMLVAIFTLSIAPSVPLQSNPPSVPRWRANGCFRAEGVRSCRSGDERGMGRVDGWARHSVQEEVANRSTGLARISRRPRCLNFCLPRSPGESAPALHPPGATRPNSRAYSLFAVIPGERRSVPAVCALTPDRVHPAVELGVGVDVALCVRAEVQMTADDFVEVGGLLKAGHATQRQWLDADLHDVAANVPLAITRR